MKTGIAALPASRSVLNFYGYALIEAGRTRKESVRSNGYALAPREANPYDSLAEGCRSRIAERRWALPASDRRRPFSGSRHLAWALAVLGRYDETLASQDLKSGSLSAFG
jgi:hypothetical protein